MKKINNRYCFYLNLSIILLFNYLDLISSATAKVFDPDSFTLNNGMKVVLIRNHRIPVITHMVWYRVGSADEPQGQTGIAHFLEHLMFKGTKNYKPGEFSQIVSRNGGKGNAFTSTDYTAYYQTIAVKHLSKVMKMEADRMSNLVITKKEIRTEVQVILEERRSRIENSPRGLLSEQLNASLFINHPYRNPVIGWKKDIVNLNKSQIKSFYKKWYIPNNAILVISGDMTMAQLKPLAEKYYGKIPKKSLVQRSWAKEPQHTASRRIIIKDNRVNHPSWRRTYLAPSLKWGDTRLAHPLELIADIFGGGTTSLLFKNLVIKKKVATSIGAYYRGDGRGPGRFIIYAQPQENVSIEQLEKQIKSEITLLIQNGISENELARSKKRLTAAAIFARDSVSGGANTLGSTLASGLSIEDVESWPEKISNVTEANINKAIEMVFDEKQSVTGILLPDLNQNKN